MIAETARLLRTMDIYIQPTRPYSGVFGRKDNFRWRWGSKSSRWALLPPCCGRFDIVSDGNAPGRIGFI